MSYFSNNNPYPPISGDYINVQQNNNPQQSTQNQGGNNFNGLLSAPNLQNQNNTTSPLSSYNYISSGSNANGSQRQQLQSPGILFNNLAMSSTSGNDSNSNNNNNYTNSSASSAASSYQSLALSSPQSSNISLFSSHRAKFMSSKGFEIDDDLEFCPEIVNAKRFNPYTSSSFSPNSTIVSTVNQSSTSPTSNTNSMMSTPTPVAPNRPSSPSPRVFTPRAKKILEIVNPSTGMKIGSPTTGHATISPIK